MSSLSIILVIAVGIVFIHNFCRVKFFGGHSYFGNSKNPVATLCAGGVLTVLAVASAFASWLGFKLLLAPLKVGYLSAAVFALVMLGLVLVVRLPLKKFAFYNNSGVNLLFVGAECAALFVAITLVSKTYSLSFLLLNGLYCALGFSVVLFSFACLVQRIDHCDVPKRFSGLPVAITTIIILAIAFAGFSGIKF